MCTVSSRFVLLQLQNWSVLSSGRPLNPALSTLEGSVLHLANVSARLACGSLMGWKYLGMLEYFNGKERTRGEQIIPAPVKSACLMMSESLELFHWLLTVTKSLESQVRVLGCLCRKNLIFLDLILSDIMVSMSGDLQSRDAIKESCSQYFRKKLGDDLAFKYIDGCWDM